MPSREATVTGLEGKRNMASSRAKRSAYYQAHMNCAELTYQHSLQDRPYPCLSILFSLLSISFNLGWLRRRFTLSQRSSL